MPTSTFYRLRPERRERMLAQAVEVFSESTFEEASIRCIIKAMEITTGSFYRYFVSKEELYIFLVDEMLVTFWQAVSGHAVALQSHVPLDEIDRLVPAQSRFWHSFFASSPEIRKKYYFRVQDNALYMRFLRNIHSMPQLSHHSEQLLGLTAFLLNVLHYVVTSYREISGAEYKDDEMFPVLRDVIIKGLAAL